METDSGYSVLDIDDCPRQSRKIDTHHSISAASICISLSLCPNTSSLLHILSLHERVCNLISERGDVIALVHPSIGNGPFHIVLAQPVSFARLEVGEPAKCWKNSIQFKHLTIDLSRAAMWDPTLPQVGGIISADAWHSLREHIRHADTSAAPELTALDVAVTERTQQAATHLLTGLHLGRDSELVRGTELLAGLGIGLTPAGDDFLLGFMARIWLESALRPTDWTATDLCQVIAQTAGPRTTLLSRTWLEYAARGQFAISWRDLAAALAVFNQDAIHLAADRILNTGATSGKDATAGFLLPDT